MELTSWWEETHIRHERCSVSDGENVVQTNTAEEMCGFEGLREQLGKGVQGRLQEWVTLELIPRLSPGVSCLSESGGGRYGPSEL